jgi:isopentenyl-diphosphate delta-isomerase
MRTTALHPGALRNGTSPRDLRPKCCTDWSWRASLMKHETVSFDDEPLILVDSEDRVVGHETKINAHLGDGILHRAFSIFLFSDDDKVLLQQRSGEKPLWPLFWSNSCCSHPRRGENLDQATHRRLREELAVDADLRFLYKFEYQADFGALGAEHELCSVYVGKVSTPVAVDVNPSEIADWQWIPCVETDRMVVEEPERVTPWFSMEWRRLRTEYRELIDSLSPVPLQKVA